MICFSLYSAERRVNALYRELLAPWNLSYTQYLVLVALWNEPALSVSALGRLLGLDSGTLSPLLKRMERNGLVQKNRRVDDERGVQITLTDKGSGLNEELSHIPSCFIDRIGMPLDDALVLRDHAKVLGKTRILSNVQ